MHKAKVKGVSMGEYGSYFLAAEITSFQKVWSIW